jgi:hypothetical protein
VFFAAVNVFLVALAALLATIVRPAALGRALPAALRDQESARRIRLQVGGLEVVGVDPM